MMERINQAILITAGTKRLGLELAKKALALGYDIIFHYRTDKKDAENRLADTVEYQSRATFLQQDLTPDNAHLLMENARAAAGSRLVGLVNNASLFTQGNLDNSDHMRVMLDSNAFVPLALSKAFKEHAGKGWIVNITDAHIDSIDTTYQNYRLSKLILTEFTRQLAGLYAPDIRVNAIAPGALLPSEIRGRTEFDRLVPTIPLRRTGDIENLNMAFEYLVRNDYVTGQVLYVDGGWHLCP